MQPNLKKNYIYRVFYEILKVITPFITAPYVARVLEPDGVGNYSFSYSIITYFMLFAALGTVSYGAREIAQNRDDKKKASKLFWEIEILTIITSSVSLIIWIGFIFFSSGSRRLLYIALTPFLLSTMFDISWYFTGYEEIKKIVVRNSFVKIMGILLLFLFVKKKEDIIVYCIINSTVSLVGNLTMWFYLPKMLQKVDFRSLNIRHHFRETLIYFIPTIATSIYTYLDKTLIGTITGSSFQNGYYEEATKIIGIVNSVTFIAVNSVMGARISYLFSKKKYDEIRDKILHTVDFIYLLGYGSLFGVIGVADRFVPLFLGNNYDSVIYLLSIMSPLIIIIGTSNCLGNLYFIPSGQRKKSAKIIVIGALLNFIFNLLLIPRFEAVGATIASIIAELFITICYIHLSSGYLNWKIIFRKSYRKVLAGMLMCIIVLAEGKWFDHVNILNVMIQILTGIVIYSGLLILLKDRIIYEVIQIGKSYFRQIFKTIFRAK